MRRLSWILAFFSLVLASAAVVFWMRSYSAQHVFSIRSRYCSSFIGAWKGRGEIVIASPIDREGWRFDYAASPLMWDSLGAICLKATGYDEGRVRAGVPSVVTASTNRRVVPVPPNHLGWRGLGIWWLNAPTAKKYCARLVMPLWLVALLACLLPVRVAAKVVRHRRRQKHGRCLSCGYDVRATKARCPECGTLIVQAA